MSSTLCTFSHNALQIKAIIDILKDLITDANLCFKKDEVSIVQMDPERVVAVSASINQIFSYQREGDEDLMIGVNMQNLYKILRGVNKNNVLKMEIMENTKNVLKITIENLVNETISTTSLYSLDIPKEQPSIPMFTYDAVLRMPTLDFVKTIKDLSHGSKKITITATRQQYPHLSYLTLSTKGDVYVYTTSISICPSEGGLEWLSFMEDKVHGQFFSRYIEKFGKPQISKTIELSMKKSGTLCLSYPEMEIGSLSMIIAPISQD